MNFLIQDIPKPPPCQGGSFKTIFLLAKPQLSKPKLDIPKLGLGNEEILYNHETMSSHFLEIVTEYAV